MTKGDQESSPVCSSTAGFVQVCKCTCVCVCVCVLGDWQNQSKKPQKTGRRFFRLHWFNHEFRKDYKTNKLQTMRVGRQVNTSALHVDRKERRSTRLVWKAEKQQINARIIEFMMWVKESFDVIITYTDKGRATPWPPNTMGLMTKYSSSVGSGFHCFVFRILIEFIHKRVGSVSK